jgi:hypothetical protein
MKIPSKISARAGGSATVPASMWNELIDYLRSTRISPSVGVRPIVTSQGTVLVAPKPKPTQAATILHPFKISAFAKTSDSGDITGYYATVTPGTINLVLTSNHFESDKLKEFTYAKDSLTYFYLNCTINADGSITQSSLETDAQVRAPEPSGLFSPPTELNALIGATYNGAVYQAVTTNLSAKLQTTSVVEKSTYDIGRYPFDLYLNWGVTA